MDILSTSNVDGSEGWAVIAGSNNWVTLNAVDVPAQWAGTLAGTDPGFMDPGDLDIRPDAGGVLVDNGNNAPAYPTGYPFPNPLFPPGNHLLLQRLSQRPEPLAPVLLNSTVQRPEDGALDTGAYEF